MPNPATKKVCKNNPKYFYTGKESSPLGLGYCALSENVGTKRIGNDDTQWIVGMKNGMRVWVRCPTELSKESPVIEKPTKIVIEDDSEDEEEAVPPPPVKKALPESSSESESEDEKPPPPPVKKAPVKKAPVKKAPPPESSSESESEEEAANPPPAPPPKKAPVKKAPPKKAPPPESSSESESEEEEQPPPKKAPVKKEDEKKAPVKRAQTDYNIYMAWKVAELGKEEPKMTHKEKFAMAAKEWKNLGDKKEEQMEKARAFKK